MHVIYYPHLQFRRFKDQRNVGQEPLMRISFF